MTEKDIKELKLGVAKDLLKSLVSKILSTKERVMFLNVQYDEISKKPTKELTENEKHFKQEHKANIAAFMDGIKEAEVHEKNFLTLIASLEENKPLTF
jgi:hypothetical protein